MSSSISAFQQARPFCDTSTSKDCSNLHRSPTYQNIFSNGSFSHDNAIVTAHFDGVDVIRKKIATHPSTFSGYNETNNEM
jgi:hypothetical protein